MYSTMQRKNLSCDCKKSLFEQSEMESGRDYKDLNSNRNEIKEKSGHGREEIIAIKNRFPTKVPVILKKFLCDKNLPVLDKMKYLVPQDISLSQFQMILRNRMQLKSNKSLYLLINNRSMISLSRTMGEVYKEFAEDDGYLYITYASQETFGGTSDTSSTKFYPRGKRLTQDKQ